MVSVLDFYRVSWRGFGYSLSFNMAMPIIIQPILVLLLNFVSFDSMIIISIISALILFICIRISKYDSCSKFFYYWTVSSITYVILVFEIIVVPLSEIEREENFFLLLFVIFSIFFLYLTKVTPDQLNHQNDLLRNGVLTEACPICRIKISPRSYHCHVCQVCIARYDYHCYWLNCCVGECNQQFFVVGLLFGMLALGYASLLILTTICQPDFMFGILFPKDCTDVSVNIGMFTCFVSGIYCMELALLLLAQLVHQLLLISMGYSALEWRELKYTISKTSTYSRGLLGNWIHFFKSLKKINM